MIRRAPAILAAAFLLPALLTPSVQAAPSANPKPAPRAETVPPGALTVLTYNVCKSLCDAPAPSWDVRRDRVARTINESGADIVGVQEATNYGVTNAKTQWLDVQNITAPAGYVAPTIPYETDECAYRKHVQCTNTARLLFKPTRVVQATSPNGAPTAGISTLAKIAGGIDAEAGIRQFMWAYLQPVGGGAPFLAISMHLSTEKDAAREAARVAVANSLTGWTDSMNAEHGFPGANVVLLADLNSYDARQPAGAQTVLRNAGWTDAMNAPSKRNIQFASINHQPQNEARWHGFPPRPYRYAHPPASRIDYVLTRGNVTPLDYETVVHLNADGTFDPAYQGSDHNAVRVVLQFG